MTARFYRWADAAGIGFVVLFVVGVLLAFASQPNYKKHDSPTVMAHKIFKIYDSSGSRAQIIIGAYLLVLSALTLVWFTVGLRARLVAAGRSPAVGRLLLGFAALAGAAIIVSALAMAAIAGSYVFGNEPLPTNADAIRTINDFGSGLLLVGFGLSIAALIATVTVVAWRTALLPRWLTYGGVLGVLAGVLAVTFLPLVLVMVWVLAVAIVGLRRPSADLADRPEIAVAMVESTIIETPAAPENVPPAL